MSQFLAKMLRITKLISSRGCWPGQQLICGARSQDRTVPCSSRPLRWPGQQIINAYRTPKR